MEKPIGDAIASEAAVGEPFAAAGPVCCPACQKTGDGEYCVHCGEDLHPERITVRFIIKQFSELYLGFETSRLLRTFRDLTLHPGKTLRTYFEGNRSSYYNPLDYLLLMVGFDILVLLLFFGSTMGRFTLPPQVDPGDGGLMSAIGEDPGATINMIYLIQLPLLALCTWLRNRRGAFTLGEHLYANAFIFSQIFAYHILVMVLLKVVPVKGLLLALTYLWAIFSMGYITYAYAKWKHGVIRFPRILLTMGFIVTAYFATFFVATILTALIKTAYGLLADLF